MRNPPISPPSRACALETGVPEQLDDVRRRQAGTGLGYSLGSRGVDRRHSVASGSLEIERVCCVHRRFVSVGHDEPAIPFSRRQAGLRPALFLTADERQVEEAPPGQLRSRTSGIWAPMRLSATSSPPKGLSAGRHSRKADARRRPGRDIHRRDRALSRQILDLVFLDEWNLIAVLSCAQHRGGSRS